MQAYRKLCTTELTNAVISNHLRRPPPASGQPCLLLLDGVPVAPGDFGGGLDQQLQVGGQVKQPYSPQKLKIWYSGEGYCFAAGASPAGQPGSAATPSGGAP
jgi:hypothetical protein